MHKLYDLKEMLCKELEEYGGRTGLDMNSLEVVDKLAHAIKNIDKILMSGDENSMDGSYRGSYEESNRGSYEGGSNRGSYESSNRMSRRSSRARYRDGMGRYVMNSYANEEMIDKLRDLMDEAPDDHSRKEIEKLISKMEQG